MNRSFGKWRSFCLAINVLITNHTNALVKLVSATGKVCYVDSITDSHATNRFSENKYMALDRHNASFSWNMPYITCFDSRNLYDNLVPQWQIVLTGPMTHGTIVVF